MLRKALIIVLVLLLPLHVYAKTNYQQVAIHGDNLVENKTVRVPIVELSAKDKAQLRQRATELLKHNQEQSNFDKLKKSQDARSPNHSRYDRVVDLTMNGVTKLDQGMHGTCSTFATTALLDASVYQNDFISQLCLLALGTTLAQQDSQVSSGWNGNILEKVLERIQQYGVIDKAEEPTLHCGGFDSYPANTVRTGRGMSVEEYTAHSQKLPAKIEVVDIKQDSYKQLIENFKEELEMGNRIYLSIYIDPMSYNMGFTDNHHTYYYGDTLVLNDNLLIRMLNEEFDTLGAHGMVIYGYDDNAVHHGQKGVFFLRNSWGESFGDYGDAYVTYDYLKLMFRYAKAVRVKQY